MSGGGGSSGGTSTTNTIQKADPWSGQQPYLKDIYTKSQGLYNTTQQPFYPWRTTAPLNQSQLGGMRTQLGYAKDIYAPATQQYQSFLQGMMTAPDTVYSNPAVNNMINAQGSLINDQLQRSWLPQIRTGAINAGQYGGSRQGIAEGLAMGEASKALANSAAQTQLGAYDQAVRQQAMGAGAYPGALQMGFTPGSMLQNFGGVLQGQDQAMIAENAARFGWPYTEPWGRMQNYVSSVAGVPLGAAGSSTSKTTSDAGGGGSSLLGTGILGLSAANSLLGNTGILAGLGLLGGAGAGAMAGVDAGLTAAMGTGFLYGLPLLSDVRVKNFIRDAEEALPLVEAIDIVRFRYNGTDQDRTGVIAQQLAQIEPSAVIDTGGPDHLLAVRLDMLVPHLIKAVQELSEKVRNLEAERVRSAH